MTHTTCTSKISQLSLVQFMFLLTSSSLLFTSWCSLPLGIIAQSPAVKWSVCFHKISYPSNAAGFPAIVNLRFPLVLTLPPSETMAPFPDTAYTIVSWLPWWWTADEECGWARMSVPTICWPGYKSTMADCLIMPSYIVVRWPSKVIICTYCLTVTCFNIVCLRNPDCFWRTHF